MTKREIDEIFEWLEENMNHNCWFDFKLTEKNQITAYLKNTSRPFAVFYTNVILKILKGGKND